VRPTFIPKMVMPKREIFEKNLFMEISLFGKCQNIFKTLFSKIPFLALPFLE
jgi:hypothetical protein